MCGKSKCICAVLVGMVLLCLLSACTVQEDGMNVEAQKENDTVEQGLSSESLLFETDSKGLQIAENISEEQSSSIANNRNESMSSEMEERYKAILLGDGDFINIDHSDEDVKLSIDNIKEVVSDEDWVTAKVTKFTIIDLDGNGENEIVLWIEANDQLDYGFEILFFKDQEVYGFTLPYRGVLDLKTDGTFYYSGGIYDEGIGRLQLFERGYSIEAVSENESQEQKPDVGWYGLTPDSVELAFENKF